MNRNFTLKKFNLLYCITPSPNLVVILICVLFPFLSISTFAQKKKQNAQIATEWAKLTLQILKTTPGGSPTFNSRFLGYCGLTMYESVVKGSSDFHSLVGKVNGLDALTIPNPDMKINWALSLNAGQAQIIKHIYGFTSKANLSKIDSLES